MRSAIISFTECVSNYSKLVNLFWKGHSVSEQLFKWLPKSPFSPATPQLHEDLDQTGNHIQTTPMIPCFGKGPFVTFELANLEAIGNKDALSDAVLKCYTTQCQSSSFFTNPLFSQRRRHESKKENAMSLPFSGVSKRYPRFGPVSLHL